MLSEEPDPEALFGAGEVVTRTVGTPEFRGLTFYEVRARSIINKVPAASRMPFRWTVNPYRGCSHACRYCLAGDTPILLASGWTAPLSQLRCGEAIYGTVRDGSGRRYVLTEVLAHWRSFKRAYRLRLADGRELVTSGDHRFLTSRGWQQVSNGGDAGGNTQRGYLSRGEQLMGMGWFNTPPRKNGDYRHGYLSGVHGGNPAKSLTDLAVLPGVYRYLLGEESPRVATVPAGRWVRLWGGLQEQICFCHTIDPVSEWPRSLIGTEVSSAASLAVVEVEDVGMSLPMYDITTGTGDFIANGVVSHNCFARRTHEYLDLDSGRDFDTKIVVKVNAPELLRQELSAAHWAGDYIAMGTNVDPYQRAEGRYRLMPGILEALRDARNPFSILTKGTLVLRDLTLLRAAARVADVTVNISVGFIDEGLWRQVEPGTPAPRARLGVCRALTTAGIGCGVLMAPILPYLTDSPGQLEETVRALADAGARSITPVVLHLRPGAREWYLAWLQRAHPELVSSYQRLYGRGAYAPKTYQQDITTQVAELARRYGVGTRAGERTPQGSFRRVRARADPPQGKRSPQSSAGAEQLPLL
jgi:DNA repair photolyase